MNLVEGRVFNGQLVYSADLSPEFLQVKIRYFQ